MSETTKTRKYGRASAPAQLHIPLSVLAQMPEKLRILGERLKVASEAVGADYQGFRAAHEPLRTAFDDANGTAKCIINTFDLFAHLCTSKNIQKAVAAAREAKAVTSAMYKVSGNIHNDDCFKTTFGDVATVRATLNALNEVGDAIRAAVRPFGY